MRRQGQKHTEKTWRAEEWRSGFGDNNSHHHFSICRFCARSIKGFPVPSLCDIFIEVCLLAAILSGHLLISICHSLFGCLLFSVLLLDCCQGSHLSCLVALQASFQTQ